MLFIWVCRQIPGPIDSKLIYTSFSCCVLPSKGFY